MKSFIKYTIIIAWAVLFAPALAWTQPPAETKITTLDSAATGLQNRGFKDLFVSNNFKVGNPYTTQINPQVMPFVNTYLQRHEHQLLNMKKWAMPYFNMMDGILMSYGLPRELKYLAVIESNLQATAVSWVGAVGPWQFMPQTGRQMGLRIDGYTDDRTDYVKSTHAAARYLSELYKQLGDWLLVIAAYNGGPGRVQSAIARSGSQSFWKLQYLLPEESRNHVKKFISTHYIMEGTGGKTTSTAGEWAVQQQKIAEYNNSQPLALPQELIDSSTIIPVQGRFNSVVVANFLTMDLILFNKYNPSFDKLANSDAGYNLRLPNDKVELFKANRYNILYQSVIATMQAAQQTVTSTSSKLK